LKNNVLLQVFGEWNGAELESFLIEITRDILKFHDTDGSSLVNKILDTAGQVSQNVGVFGRASSSLVDVILDIAGQLVTS